VLASQMLPDLCRKGHEFIVVSSHGDLDLPHEMRFGDIPVYRFPFFEALNARDPGQIFSLQRRIADLKRAFKPHVTHLNFSDPGVFFHLHTKSAHPTAEVLTLCVRLPASLSRQGVFAEAVRSATQITCCAEALRQQVVALLPEAAPKCRVILNGVRRPDNEPAALPIDAPRLLCLGRAVREKGFDLALEAVARLVHRYPALHLVVAGDGPERPALEQQAKELGISRQVEFRGWVHPEEVLNLINRVTAVLLPSRQRFEALPLAGLQAALMGRPVIGARVGGMDEVVVHGETGYLFKEEDVAKLASAIEELLSRPERLRRLGCTARERAQQTFTLERHVEAYDRLYREVASKALVTG